jgi:hypothetical protein
LHTEAECATEVADENKLKEVMDRAVDPAAALGEEDHKFVGDNCLADSLGDKNLFALWEGLQHKSCEVAIFAEEEKVLLVQGVDYVLRVVFHNVGISEDGDPVVLAAFGGFDSIHGETTWETGNTTKDGFERFSLVVGNEVSGHC